MKKFRLFAVLIAFILVMASCTKDGEVDDSINSSRDFIRESEAKDDEANQVVENINKDDISILISDNADTKAADAGIDLAKKAFSYMFVDDSDSVYEMMDERLQEYVEPIGLEEEWGALIEKTGKMQNIYEMSVQQQEGFTIITSKINCENAKLQMVTSSEDNVEELLGFQFTVLAEAEALEKELPEGASEIDIIVNKGGDYELRGKITLPGGAASTSKVPAAVLINGSGASDMDESVYAFKPLRDIAYGLAENGVASIRFEKRNYAYPSADFSTVETEVVQDVVTATELLKTYDEIDTSRVFAVGHSMGGMLAPRIDISGADFKGYVLVASTPFNIGEVVMHQSKAQIEASKAVAGEEAYKQSMENFYAEVEAMDSVTSVITEAQARSVMAFGVNGYYLQDFKKFDQIKILKEQKKPAFIIQGENDVQVTMDLDFAAYKEGLAGEDYVTLKSYPGLNHFFSPGTGKKDDALQEYMEPGEFDHSALKDISNFIKAN